MNATMNMPSSTSSSSGAAAGASSASLGRRGPTMFERLQYGDMISLFVEDKGFLATPAVDEAIPLAPGVQQLQQLRPVSGAEGDFALSPPSAPPPPPLSHLRVATPLDRGSKLPSDFQNRCVFEVLSEGGLKATDEPVTYGSMIQLRHPKTGFTIMVDSLGSSSSGGSGGATAAGLVQQQQQQQQLGLTTPFGGGMASATGGAHGNSNTNSTTTSSNGPLVFTRLRTATTRATETSAQFYLRPRYSVRVEGDMVRDHDRIVLESCRFKGLQLCVDKRADAAAAAAAAATTAASFPADGGLMRRTSSLQPLDGNEGGLAGQARIQEGVVSVSDDAYLRSGWQIHLISRARHTMGRDHLSSSAGAAMAAAAASQGPSNVGAAGQHDHYHREGGGGGASEDGVVIAGGDFVRFAHQEIVGHLIARIDDGAERCSRISPLGMVYRKSQLEKDHSVGIFLRRGATQPSALSIFQVIPHQPMSGQPIEWDAPIRLRHLLSGQYLALRPAHVKDSASLHASAKPISSIIASGSRPGTPAGSHSNHRPTDSMESVGSASLPPHSTRGAAGSNSGSGVMSPPSSPRPTVAGDAEMSSTLDAAAACLSPTSDGIDGAAAAAAAAAPAPAAAASGGARRSSRVRMVIATVEDPEDSATLFRFHPARDADTSCVTSKSKCLLVHYDTGAHLSLGHNLIAQHGKSGLRDRPGTASAAGSAGAAGGGEGAGGGLSFASVAMAARAAKAHKSRDGEEEGEGASANGASVAAWSSYWEYSNDNLVFASCEDNSDAEVYRIYPVKPSSTRHVLYALRYQPVLADAVEVVRSMRLDLSVGGECGLDATLTSSAGTQGGGGATLARLSSRMSPPIKRLGSHVFSRPEDQYVGVCQHLLYALHELMLWQAGEIDADGEIQRREGVPLFCDDPSASTRIGDRTGTAYSCNSAASAGGIRAATGGTGPSSSSASSIRGRQNAMEKDEDSFDRDLAWRRRELLRNCHLVEALLMFISVSFQLYRGRTYARSRAELLLKNASGSPSAGEGGSGEPPPFCPDALPVIDACCKCAYRLLREIMTPSCARTVLYLAGINSMVRHISLGWDPPLEEILAAAAVDQDVAVRAPSGAAGPMPAAAVTAAAAAAAAGGTGTVSAAGQGFNQYRMSTSDLYQLVLELYSSYMHKEISGTKILKLLANVCAPGNVVDAKVQSFLASLILQTKRKDGSLSSGKDAGAGLNSTFTLDDLNLVPEVTSLLFSLRPGGAQGGWRVHLSLMQEKPLYTPDMQEMRQFSEAERGIIREAFNRYDEDGNGAIDREELGLLLQDLGLQSLIVEEVKNRWNESCSFDNFCSWWHQHRYVLETWSSPFDYSAASSSTTMAGPGTASVAAAADGTAWVSGNGGPPTNRARPPAGVASPPAIIASSSQASALSAAAADLTLPPPLHIATPQSRPQSGSQQLSSPPPPSSSPLSSPAKPTTPLSSMLFKKRQRHLAPRSLTLEDEIGEDDLFAMPDAIFRRWIDLELLFTHERFAAEAKWIRASVRLLVALCRGRNLVSQRLVGSIVPVDAVLYLLHSNALKERDKALFCDLLRTCYVEHDLVFPVTPLLPKQATCLSLEPEAVAHGEMGRVFNPLSQVLLSLASLSTNPAEQREGLRAFLTIHFAHLEEYVSQRDDQTAGELETFATALLRLTHALLLQGFFESDPRKQQRQQRQQQQQQQQQGRSSAAAAGGCDGTINAGMGMLTTFFEAQHPRRPPRAPSPEWGSPVGRSSLGKVDDGGRDSIGNTTLAGAARGTSLLSRVSGTPSRKPLASSLPADGAPHRLTYSFLESSLILTLEVAGSAAARRVQGVRDSLLEDVQLGYSAFFDEPGPVTLKTEVLNLLRVLVDIRSVKNFKALLWSFQAQGLSSTAMTCDVELGGSGGTSGNNAGDGTTTRSLSQLRFTKAQEAVLERGFDDRTRDGEMLVDSVVSTTAHRDKQLLIQAYDLLYHHAVQRVAFTKLLDQVKVTRHPSLAITMRMQRMVLELFDKHVPGFLLKSRGTCDVLSYALHLLNRMCYRDWNDHAQHLASPGAAGTANAGAVPPPMGPVMASGQKREKARRFRGGPVDVAAMFGPSSSTSSSPRDGDEAGFGDAAGTTSTKVPFVTSQGLGLDDFCSQPIPAQQRELQWAARRLAGFVARVLDATNGGNGPVEGLTKSHSLGTSNPATAGSSPTNSDAARIGVMDCSYYTATMDASTTAHGPGVPTEGLASSCTTLSVEQRRVLNECFAFLVDACRNHDELIRALVMPQLRVLRTRAFEFPNAMRLLAALARHSLKATRLQPHDIDQVLSHAFPSKAEATVAAAVDLQHQTASLGLLRAILESALKDEPASMSMEDALDEEMEFKTMGDRSVQLALKGATLTAVGDHFLVDTAEDGRVLSLANLGLGPPSSSPSSPASTSRLASKSWTFKSEGLGLVCACLEAVNELELSGAGTPSSSSSALPPSSLLSPTSATFPPASSGSSISVDVLWETRERITALFPPTACLQSALDAQLPLPIRSLLLKLVRLQAFTATPRPPSSSSSSPAATRPSSLSSSAVRVSEHDLRPSRLSSLGSLESSIPLSMPPSLTKVSLELMHAFATNAQAELDALRRSFKYGTVTLKALEGMAALPFLFKTIPSFILAFLKHQGYDHAIDDVVQASLDRAKRKIEKEQTRSRLWKATDSSLPQKVAKALLTDRAEEVMIWVLDTFERQHQLARKPVHQPTQPQQMHEGERAPQAPAPAGFLASLSRIGSSPSLVTPPPGSPQSPSRTSVPLHQRGSLTPHHPGLPSSLERKVLGQILNLIDRLASVILRSPAIQAQWAASYDPWAETLLTLLAFGTLADRVHQILTPPASLPAPTAAAATAGAGGGVATAVAANLTKALSGLSSAATGLAVTAATPLNATAAALLPNRKVTLDNSTASESQGMGPRLSQTSKTLRAAAGLTADFVTAAADARFVLHLTQALAARRAAERTASEERDVVENQVPVMIEETRSYVLNVYEPRGPVDDGDANQCHHLASVGWQAAKEWVSSKLNLGEDSEEAASCLATTSSSSFPLHQHRHCHHSQAAAVAAGRVLTYPPSVAATDSLIRRVLWRQFESFMEYYYEDGDDEEDELEGSHDGNRRVRHDLHMHHSRPRSYAPQDSLDERASSHAAAMSGSRSFRAWSKAGGLFIEHILLMIRYRVWEEDDCCLFFLDVVTQFLEDDLARIRREGASRFDAQKLIKLVQAEVAGQQKKQQALQVVDGHVVLMAIVAQAAQPGFVASKAPALLKIMPRVLQFGTRLMATGNRQVQETIMDFYEKAIVELLVQRKFCVGLRNMLRFCRYQVETLMYSVNTAVGVGLEAAGPAAPEQLEALIQESQPTLELVGSLFDFLGSLCAGHNMRARSFLREQRVSGDSVNLVAECASLVFTLGSYTRGLMTYVENRTFGSKVAPAVHLSQAKKTRRFIAWHQNPRKFAHLTDLLQVVGQGFNSLTEMVQGPCRENQVLCERLCTFAGEILEYTGTIHLELPSRRNHNRLWSGGDPLKFYELYAKEMARVGGGGDGSGFGIGGGRAGGVTAGGQAPPRPVSFMPGSMAAAAVTAATSSQQQRQQDLEDLETMQILESLRLWRRVGERKMFSFHLHITKAFQALSSTQRREGGATAAASTATGAAGGGARPMTMNNAAMGALTSKDILGVDLQDFTSVCLGAEKSSLKFVTAMLEGQNPGVVDHVRSSIDSFILFQNMDSLTRGTVQGPTTVAGSLSSASSAAASSLPSFSSAATGAGSTGTSTATTLSSSSSSSPASFDAERTQAKQEAAVLYLTILSSLASLSSLATGGDDYGLRMTKVLEEWQDIFAKQGVHGSAAGVNTLVASVEIVGLDGQVQQVFFAPPAWIKQYWNYPLVQKAKRELAYQVNRASPEEKILDFYDRMTLLTKVMRRQQLLHRIFTVFHGFVGGKSVDSRWLPNPRAILLVLTLLLNMWLCTRLYYRDMPDEPSAIWREFLSWRTTPTLVWGVKYCHLALCLSLLFTAALNSGAGDGVRGHAMHLPGGRKVMSFDWLLRLYVVLNDVRWLLIMSVLSGVGLWVTEMAYPFCVVDVIPQIRLMKFLLEAITRNSHKIWLTVLLCMVVLYVFSTISYMVFQNQYGFEGMMDCDSLATCFKLHLDYGIAHSPLWIGHGAINPTIHTTLVTTPAQKSAFDFAMTIVSSLFNLMYVILVNLVLSAIIAGIIIDTFGQMRSENEAIEEDMKEKCFICSIDRDLIESAGISFHDHIRNQHNMWSYFWFRAYLNGKDPLTLTGPEMYAFEMFKDKKNLTRFFPLKKSLIIERKNIELKSKNEVDVLSGRVVSVEAQLGKLSNAVQKLVDQHANQGNKMAQEQHQLAGTASETVEMLKALHVLVAAQQQQQQQHVGGGGKSSTGGAGTRGRDIFLNKVTLAQRERERQQEQQQEDQQEDQRRKRHNQQQHQPPQAPASATTTAVSGPLSVKTSPRWRAAVAKSGKGTHDSIGVEESKESK